MADKSTLMLKKENLEILKENQALKETVTALLSEIERLKEVKAPSNVTKIELSTEQRIIEEQIRFYSTISNQGPMELDDIRALDLLVKNKKALDELNKPIEADYTKVPEGKTETDLLRIAENVESINSIRDKSKTSQEDPVA